MMSQCGNDHAHIHLACLSKEYDSWLKAGAKTKERSIAHRLKYFGAMGQGYNRAKPLDTNCKRFLLLVEHTLSNSFTHNEFRFLYGNYFWEAWGRIAGILLIKKDPTADDIGESSILDNLIRDFGKNEWQHRKLIVKGFNRLVPLSVGYEDAILEVFSYFRAYSEASCSGILGELPEPVCNCISWLVESNCQIAERLSNGKPGLGYTSPFAHEVIISAGKLIELTVRACESESFKPVIGEVIPQWHKTVFEWMFREEDIRKSSHIIKVSHDVKEAVTELVSKLNAIRGYGEMRYTLCEFKRKCESINSKITAK